MDSPLHILLPKIFKCPSTVTFCPFSSFPLLSLSSSQSFGDLRGVACRRPLFYHPNALLASCVLTMAPITSLMAMIASFYLKNNESQSNESRSGHRVRIRRQISANIKDIEDFVLGFVKFEWLWSLSNMLVLVCNIFIIGWFRLLYFFG